MTDSDSYVDARRALGRRPGGQAPPKLHIDEGPLEIIPPSPITSFDPSASGRHVSLAIPPDQSFLPPSPTSPSRITSEPSRRFRRPTISRAKVPPTQIKGLYETQKLLSHLLDRIEARERAPDLLDRAAIAARHASGSGKSKVKGKGRNLGHGISQQALDKTQKYPAGLSGIGNEDYEERFTIEEGEWDSERIYDLVEQLRGLLVLADKQGLEIFGTSSSNGGTSPTPLRAKKKGRLSSFTSPNPSNPAEEDALLPFDSDNMSLFGPALLSRTIAMTRSLINVDCLHRTLRFRPLCPPNALQSACLDLASYLYHHGDVRTEILVTEMVIDGLFGMGEGMTEKLCEWLEGRLGELLRRLAKDRGGSNLGHKQNSDWNDPFATASQSTGSPSVPTFALSIDPGDSTNVSKPSPGWVRYSPVTRTSPSFQLTVQVPGLVSTHSSACEATDVTLLISALIPRLLVAITSTVNLASSSLTTIHRVHRLLSMVLVAKPDSALDLLEIVALAPPQSRRTAIEVLSTFYPEVLGHNAIARRSALCSYDTQRQKWETGQDRVFGEDDTEGHHYIPWRISDNGHPGSELTCFECEADLKGFCVRCTLCRDIRHLNCYHPMDDIFIYDVIHLSNRESMPRTVRVKFSRTITRLEEKVIHGIAVHGSPESTSRCIGRHKLHLVNVFSLTNCEECREPLWGCAGQAYACIGGCQRFFHPRCVSSLESGPASECKYGRDVVIDEISGQGKDPFSISHSSLDRSFDNEFRHIRLSPEELQARSYDEIAVLYGVLWAQYQIYKNGVESGSIRISDEEYTIDSDSLRFQETLLAYESHLAEKIEQASSAATDFAHVSSIGQPLAEGYMYSDQFLSYCTALLRAPTDRTNGVLPSGGLLTADDLSIHGNSGDSPSQESYEMLPLPTMCQGVSADLNINDPKIAVHLLEQLRLAGMFTVSACRAITAASITDSKTWCSFNLPWLMDSSPTVELLILAVEVLLDDLDLTSNEQALRLLATRAWPSLLCSPYGLERLGCAVVGWIMAEDESLHQLVKVYASKRKRLPGVRTGPAGSSQAKGTSSVAIYKEDRGRLLVRHARPWLAALHQQDPALYAHIVYVQCKTPSKEGRNDQPDPVDEKKVKEDASTVAALALERMTTMVDSEVIFSVLLDLLTAWLEDLGPLANEDVVYKSLPRLLQQSSANNSIMRESPSDDIWSLAKSISSQSLEGLERVCRWMRVLAFSGVKIPWSNLVDLVSIQSTFTSSVDARLDLVAAVNACGAEADPEDFAALSSRMFTDLTDNITKGVVKASPSETELELLRQHLLMVLLSYGVTTESISSTSLHVEGDLISQLASISRKRRMPNIRVTLALNASVVNSATSLLGNPDFPTIMLLDFMWLLFTKANYLANVEVFLHTSCKPIYDVLWPSFDFLLDRRCRARVFLRLLAINPLPLEDLVAKQLASDDRPSVHERLLKFLLEIADDSVTFENIGWRSSAVGLINLFFDALLHPLHASQNDMVVKLGLVQTQLHAVSTCYQEYLIQSSDDRRLSLMNRLHQLHLSFPTWQILPWQVIEELLVEQVSAVAHLGSPETSQGKSALYDAQMLRASLLALSLKMFSTGIKIAWGVLQRFQQHVASLCSLPWLQPTDGIINLLLPSLREVLDSPIRISLGVQGGETKASKKSALIGSLFVPVVIDLGTELNRHGYLIQRCLLDILMVTFFKQNTRPVELAALAALQTLAEFALNGTSVDNRLFAISILQIALERVEKDSLFRVVPTLFGIMANTLVKESKDEGDAAIVEQVKRLLLAMIQSFGRSGLYLQLLRNDSLSISASNSQSSLGSAVLVIHAEQANASPKSLRPTIVDELFGDLSDMLKRGRATVVQVLDALDRFTSHLNVELSASAAEGFGLFLSRLGKHVAEWEPMEFDPNPILRVCMALLGKVPSTTSTTLLYQTSTFLHMSLSRFDVQRGTIEGLLHISNLITENRSTENTIQAVILDMAVSAVLSHHPVTVTTHLSLLTFLTTPAFDLTETGSTLKKQRARVLADVCPGCITTLLRNLPAGPHIRQDPETNTRILLAAANVLVTAEAASPGSLSQALAVTITSEAASVQLSVFSYILLSATESSEPTRRNGVLSLYPVIARAASLGLRGCTDLLSLQDTAGSGVELLSAVFLVIRLVVLCAQDERNNKDIRETEVGRDQRLRLDALVVFWNRVWPNLARLVSLSLSGECVNGPLRAVTHSVFSDTVNFLAAAQSPIMVACAGPLRQTASSLASLYPAGSGGSGIAKLSKTVRAIERSDRSTASVNKTALLGDLKGDLLATERLRLLRSSG